MVDALAIWLMFVLAVLVLCVVKPNSGRIFLGLLYLAVAIGVNIALSFLNPPAFVELGKNALIPFYRELFHDIVALNPPLFGLLAATFQIAVGLLILNRKSYVRIGLVAGIIFNIAIMPLGVEETPNWILALAQVSLLRKEFDTSFLEILHANLRKSKSSHGTLPARIGGRPLFFLQCLTRGLPRPANPIHVDTKNSALCNIPGLMVRAHTQCLNDDGSKPVQQKCGDEKGNARPT